MSHTIRDQKKLLARVRRIRGQVDGIERALTSQAGCEQVMHLIAGARGAMAGLMAEVVEDHVVDAPASARQGRASSSWADREISVASSPTWPASMIPIGRPSRDTPAHTDAAGERVMLKG